MLTKRFHIGKSQTQSCISFRLPDSESHTAAKLRPFRDPAAIPTLLAISRALRIQRLDVTEPRVGKACHASCRVAFKDVKIFVVHLAHRRNAKIEFEILT